MIVWGPTLRQGGQLLRVGYDATTCWLALADHHPTGIHMALLQSPLQEGAPSGFWLWHSERFIMTKTDEEECEAVFDLSLDAMDPSEFLDAQPA